MDTAGLVALLTAPEAHPLVALDRWYDPDETGPRRLHALRSVRIAESLLALSRRKRLRARLYSGEDPSAIELTVAIAQRFAREVAEQGGTPLVLLIPMRDLLPVQTSGLAMALLLGEGAPLTPADWGKYALTGVIHILVISGQHLVVLALFLWWSLRRLGVRQRPGALIVALCLLTYALLTGWRPPAARSAVTSARTLGCVSSAKSVEPMSR